MKKRVMNKRKRQALLVLPVVVIPFLTLAFWALGGGRGESSGGTGNTGLNLELPGAQFKKDEAQNKMGSYEQAERDSAKMRQGLKNDPAYSMAFPGLDTTGSRTPVQPHESYQPYPFPTGGKDPNEEKVYQKLAELNQQLKDPNSGNTHSGMEGSSRPSAQNIYSRAVKSSGDVPVDNREDTSKEDAEMNGLNEMMEKVLDIQHPERVRERIKESSAAGKTRALTVQQRNEKASVSLLDAAPKKGVVTNGFFGLSIPNQPTEKGAIEAMVHGSQTLVDGAVIKLRLLQDLSVNGTAVPRDAFVFALVSLSGERLQAEIHSIRYGAALLPVKLALYDTDGLPGIYIPGAITRDVAKTSVDNAAQMLEVSSLDPSLKAQAASAGLGAVKSLLSKKTKLVKVVVKSGYRVLLKDLSTD